MAETESEMQQNRKFITKNFTFFKDIYQTKEEMLGYCEKFRGTHETLTVSDFLAIHEYARALNENFSREFSPMTTKIKKEACNQEVKI